MRKLKLEMDELRVESFQTERPREREGTVVGHYPTPQCSGEDGYTCDYSCGGQYASCVATCGSCNCIKYPPSEWTNYYQDTICMAG